MERLLTAIRQPVSEETKKRGPKPKVSWEDDFKQKIEKRLWLGVAKESLDAECKVLADEYNAQKVRVPGDDSTPITYQRLRELYRGDNPDGAQHYSQVRKERLDRLLEAGRAFLALYQPWKQS